MAIVIFQEKINVYGVPGWLVRGKFYPGRPFDQLATELEIPIEDVQVVMLPPEQKKGVRLIPPKDGPPFGF